MNLLNRKVLITGGSGYLAKALLKKVLSQNPDSVLCVARNEGKLLEVQKEFGIDIMSGDIADRGFVERIMKGRDCIFHLAGFKHIPMAEQQSQACINTNVLGSKNILDASLYSEPEFVIGTSTDKAYNPINCYGMTKRLMEYMFAEYEREKGSLKTKYRIARYGNVLGSTGSVIEIWKTADVIKVTDPDMTRFFFIVEQAVETLFECLDKQTDATPYIPVMKAMRLGDLAEVMANGRPIEIIGNRGGEKMNEGMADGVSSDSVELYTKTEIKELIKVL